MSNVAVDSPPARVFLTAGWHHLAMLNFPIDPAVLAPFVPAGTELDFLGDQTYVSIIGFQFLHTKVLGIPIPFHRDFVEVNLRFYVRRRGPEGWRRGVVFLREIVPRAMVTFVANWWYNEKYVTMPMRHQIVAPTETAAGLVRYEWAQAERWHGITVQPQGTPEQPGAGSIEEFITEHYFGYTTQRNGSTLEYGVEHPPWRVWSAASAELDCDVEAIYGKAFAPYLRTPTSAFVADGSAVVVRRGVRV